MQVWFRITNGNTSTERNVRFFFFMCCIMYHSHFSIQIQNIKKRYECGTSSTAATTTLMCTRVVCSGLPTGPADATVTYDTCVSGQMLHALNDSCTTSCISGYSGSGTYTCNPVTSQPVYSGTCTQNECSSLTFVHPIVPSSISNSCTSGQIL